MLRQCAAAVWLTAAAAPLVAVSMLVAASVLAAACSEQQGPTQGVADAPCYPDQSCNPGLTCVEGICRGTTPTPPPDGGAADQLGPPPPATCACTQAGAKRCAGNTAQLCAGGAWTSASQCGSGDVCAFGACVPEGSGCPDSGTYDSNATLAQRDEPVAIGECKDGSGATVSYVDQQSVSLSRSVSFQLPEACGNPFSLGLELKAIFGLDTGAAVSSAQISAPAVNVAVGSKYQLYRQTTKLWRVASLTAGGAFVGTAVLTDYQFTAQVAVGSSCPVAHSLLPAITATSPCVTHLDQCSCP